MLEGKTTDIYINLINCIKDEVDTLNLTLDPKIIMLDFEQGAIKAFRRAFPSTKIKS